MAHWQRCSKTPGQFSSEYAVSGQEFNGRGFSLFVPKEYVQNEQAPNGDKPVRGWLRVSVWDRSHDLLVVRLPRPSLEMGRFVTVRTNQVYTAEPSETGAAEKPGRGTLPPGMSHDPGRRWP